jgi:hypothetical protein
MFQQGLRGYQASLPLTPFGDSDLAAGQEHMMKSAYCFSERGDAKRGA